MSFRICCSCVAAMGMFVIPWNGSAGDAKLVERGTTGLTVHWVSDATDSGKTLVRVSGLSSAAIDELQRTGWTLAQWQRVLAVRTEHGNAITDIGLPAMAGAYRVDSNALQFTPQFPLTAGIRYRATFDPRALSAAPEKFAAPLSAVFELPLVHPASMTVVSHIYPSADVLPENLLKFYVHFSAPMSRGGIYEHIRVRDDTGKAVELPFLEIDEELWDPEMTRLTLFIDPGRIKHGVRPLEEIGPALEEGKRYTLVIDGTWKDAQGAPLRAPFEKRFRVAAPNRKPPDPSRWTLSIPNTGTRAPLVAAFPDPMDHALAQRMIRVTTDSGQAVEGKVGMSDQERRWEFTPSNLWPVGRYRLVIQTAIEDLAGNNIGKPFEVDLFDGVQRQLTNSTVHLPFEIR